MAPNLKAIAKEMAKSAIGTDKVRIQVDPEDPDEVRTFLVWLSSDLSADAAKSLCRGWARIIRKSLPERRDGWSSAVIVIRPLGSPLGMYFIGWANHEDTWEDPDISGETDSREWNALYRRLHRYLRGRGKNDSQGNGDYFLLDEDYGNPDQSITIYRIEFLTRDLASGIQDILKDGYPNWSVFVALDLLPPVDGVTSDGIEIYANHVVEKWDRAILAKRLGRRLKF